ncbi:MAG: sulfatase-like hydrolase/transferase, partial [Planctomycetota bacterium]
ILCDDLGYGDLGCYGHPHIATPHLDALAKSGMRLSACYSAAPVCSPSRVGLLTGRSPNRAGVYDWIPAAESGPRPDAREKVHMRDQETTLADRLKAAGYQTAMAGKWHCNSRFNQPAQPQPGDFGFDHWMATQNNASPSHRNPRNFVRNGQELGELEGFSCQLVVDEAIGWLDSVDPKQPFFLFLPFHEPHEPVASPESLVAQYRDVAVGEDQAQYFANVANLDDAVGRMIDALDKRNCRENTLVIFTSDNGPETLKRYVRANRSYGSPGPLRGMKLHTTDAGFRVPGIVSWPKRIASNQQIGVPVSALDWMPTLCRLAGADPPDRELDGVDITPLLDGEKLSRRKPLVWAYYNALNQRRVAMRSGHYKVLARIDGMERRQNLTPKGHAKLLQAKLVDFEIFDVHSDLGEATNLADSLPQAAELKQELRREYEALLNDSPTW